MQNLRSPEVYDMKRTIIATAGAIAIAAGIAFADTLELADNTLPRS